MNTATKLASIARANHQPVKSTISGFERKVKWGSHQYVRFVVNEAKERAMKGFGSVVITIDKTTDLFGIDEGRNSCYDSSFVCQLLHKEGFKLDNGQYEDHYDAFSTILVWDKDLPQSPNKIGMCWK